MLSERRRVFGGQRRVRARQRRTVTERPESTVPPAARERDRGLKADQPQPGKEKQMGIRHRVVYPSHPES